MTSQRILCLSLLALAATGCNGTGGGIGSAGSTAGSATAPTTSGSGAVPAKTLTAGAAKIAAVVVTPASPTAAIGSAPVAFRAQALDASGKPIAASTAPIWTATGGVVDSSGNWSPYAGPGNYKVTATFGSVAGSTGVTVLSVPPETSSIYGIFDADPAAAAALRANGSTGGYVVDTLSVKTFHDSGHTTGWDQTAYAGLGSGITVIARLNWDYGPNGTIPPVGQPGDPFPDYGAYAQELASFAVRVSSAMFIIGNEPNLSGEWPTRNGVADPIAPDTYVACYRACYAAIKTVRPDATIMPAPVGLWDPGTQASGIPDFIDYWQQEIVAVEGLGMLDALAMHAFSHGYDDAASGVTTNFAIDPTLATVDGKQVDWNFQVLADLLGNIPAGAARGLPIYITECNGLVAADASTPPRVWPQRSEAWIQNIYDFVASWNLTPARQTIRSVCLFRWTDAVYGGLQYGIGSSPQAVSDLEASCAQHYTWR